MASEPLAPDAIVSSSGLSGAVTAIDEDPDSPDGSWLTAPGSNTNTDVRVSFPTPSNTPTVGAGLQEFRVLVRKTSHSTNPTAVVELWETGGGAALATVVSSTTISSTTGVVLSGTFNASLLGTANGSAVECRVVGSVGGGSPGNRASVEVGAIEWVAEVDSGVTENAATTVAATSAVSPTLTVRRGLVASVAAIGSVSPSVARTRGIAAAVAGVSAVSAGLLAIPGLADASFPTFAARVGPVQVGEDYYCWLYDGDQRLVMYRSRNPGARAAVRQHKFFHATTADPTVSFDVSPLPGNSVLVLIGHQHDGDDATASDNQGNSYVLDGGNGFVFDNSYASVLRAGSIAADGGTFTVTVNQNSTIEDIAGSIIEVSGLTGEVDLVATCETTTFPWEPTPPLVIPARSEAEEFIVAVYGSQTLVTYDEASDLRDLDNEPLALDYTGYQSQFVVTSTADEITSLVEERDDGVGVAVAYFTKPEWEAVAWDVAGAITAIDGVVVGDEIHIATVGSGSVGHWVFDTTTGTFTTIDEAASITSPTVPCVGIAVRSDGDVIIGYGAGATTSQRVYYTRNEGAGWQAPVQVSGAVQTYLNAMILGASDRVHFFWKEDGANNVEHRSLTSTNTLNAEETVYTDGASADSITVGPCATFVDSGTTYVVAPCRRFNSTFRTLTFASVDTPGDLTPGTQVTATAIYGGVGTPIWPVISGGGLRLFSFWTDNATRDLWSSRGLWGGSSVAWAAAKERIDAATIARISAGYLDLAFSAFDRSGNHLGVLIDNGGTNEVRLFNVGDLAVTIPAVSTVSATLSDAVAVVALAVAVAASASVAPSASVARALVTTVPATSAVAMAASVARALATSVAAVSTVVPATSVARLLATTIPAVSLVSPFIAGVPWARVLGAFEVDADDWAVNAGSGARTSAVANGGAFAFSVSPSNLDKAGAVHWPGTFGEPVDASTTYLLRASAYLQASGGVTDEIQLLAVYYDASGVYLGEHSGGAWPISGAWDRRTLTFTTPASTAYLRAHIVTWGAQGSIQYAIDDVYLDEPTVVPVATVVAGLSAVAAFLRRRTPVAVSVPAVSSLAPVITRRRSMAVTVPATSAVALDLTVTAGAVSLAVAIAASSALSVTLTRRTPVAVTIPAVSAVSLTATRRRAVATSVAAVSAVVPAMSVGRRLAAQVAAAGVLAPVLTRRTPLAVSVGATSSLAALLRLLSPLAVTVSATSSLAAAVTRTRGLVVTVEGAGDVLPTITRRRPLAVTVDASGAVSLVLSRDLALATTVPATSSLSLILTTAGEIALVVTIAATSTLSLAASVDRALVTAIAATTAVSPTVTRRRSVAVTIPAAASVSPSLPVARSLAASVASLSAVSMTATRRRAIATTVPATSSVTLDLTLSGAVALAVMIAASSTVTASASVARALATLVDASSTVSLSLPLRRSVAVAIAATSAVSPTVTRRRSVATLIAAATDVVVEATRRRALAVSVPASATVSPTVTRRRAMVVAIGALTALALSPTRRRGLAVPVQAVASVVVSLRFVGTVELAVVIAAASAVSASVTRTESIATMAMTVYLAGLYEQEIQRRGLYAQTIRIDGLFSPEVEV